MQAGTSAIDQAGYAALTHGVALQSRPDAAVLAVSDADRADFLHRITTNDINALRPGQATVTVLTGPTARIRFVFTVVCREEELWLLPARGQAAALTQHLRGQIFFMDKVKVQEMPYARARLMGPAAAELLARLGWDTAASNGAAWQEHAGTVLVQQPDYDVPGFEIAAPADRASALWERLRQEGAQILADGIDDADAAYTARRVELGRPAPGHELTEDYNPLEAGVAWACSPNKGCYTGQEIIARQVTYDKVTKTLVGLSCDGEVAAGDDVLADGHVVGKVTSAAYSLALQQPLALAVVKRPHNQTGVTVSVGDSAAQVAALPFVHD